MRESTKLSKASRILVNKSGIRLSGTYGDVPFIGTVKDWRLVEYSAYMPADAGEITIQLDTPIRAYGSELDRTEILAITDIKGGLKDSRYQCIQIINE